MLYLLLCKSWFCEDVTDIVLFFLIISQIYDFDRDYKDIGVAQFTTKYLVVRNCVPQAKSDTLLSPWNPPQEWGKYALFPFLLYLLIFCGAPLSLLPSIVFICCNCVKG